VRGAAVSVLESLAIRGIVVVLAIGALRLLTEAVMVAHR
jgi:hypothetical protein